MTTYRALGFLALLTTFVGFADRPAAAQVAPDVTVPDAIVPDVTLGHRSNEGVSVATFNGQLLMAYIGTDKKNLLNFAASSDGVTFSGSTLFGSNSSNFTPAITVYNGRVFLAWAGRDNHFMNIASSADGLHFTNQVVMSFTSSTGPALGVANGKLYLAWTDSGIGHTVHVATTTDGINFSTMGTVTAQNGIFPPALFGVGNVMYLAYTSALTQEVLLFSAPGDLSFTGISTGVTSPRGPGLLVSSGQLYLAYSNTSDQPALNVYQLAPDGTNPSFARSQTLTGQVTVRSPSIGTLNGQLFYFWTGTNSDRNINVLQI